VSKLVYFKQTRRKQKSNSPLLKKKKKKKKDFVGLSIVNVRKLGDKIMAFSKWKIRKNMCCVQTEKREGCCTENGNLSL
jgi:hypothetical protein